LDDLLLEQAPQLLVALAPDTEEFHLLALREKRIRALAGQPHDCRIEWTAKPALGRADKQEVHVIPAGAGEEGRGGVRLSNRAGNVYPHLVDGLTLRT